MSKLKMLLSSIDFKLFLTLLLTGFIPTLYTTIRIFFLGSLPGDWGFNIASQLSYVNLMYEIIQEALILPLFFLMGASLLKKTELANKIRTGLIVTFGIYTTLSLLISIFAYPLVEFMAQNVTLVDETVTYIRLETIANIFLTLTQFITMVLITMKREKHLFGMLLAQMILTIVLDTFFISQLSFSLNLGVNGIALTNIIVNIIVLVVAISLLDKEGYHLIDRQQPLSFTWMKEWGKVGFYSGLESFVRNIAFMLMVVRMVNVVGEQGTFWVTNNFIWGWLLLPVLQLGALIKRDAAENGRVTIEKRTAGYVTLTAIIVLLWFVSIPVWLPFISNVMNVSNAEDVYRLSLISVGFYVFFAFNNIVDSIFYGIGKTQYMLFQSIVINTVFYGGLFLLHVLGIYQPTLTLIAVMFAAGTALDSILTFGMFVWMVRREKLNLDF